MTDTSIRPGGGEHRPRAEEESPTHDLEILEAFAADPVHLEAKGQYNGWCRGYHIVIQEVIRSYGDEAIPHVTADLA